MDEAATRRTAAIAESIATLDLDTAAMSYHELSLLSLAYQGHIFHPADYKKLQAAIERTRRDR